MPLLYGVVAAPARAVQLLRRRVTIVSDIVAMHILLTGGTGFIGSALAADLLAKGHRLTIVSRSAHADRPHCRFVRSFDDIDASTAIDAVVNLAGASLAGKRWNRDYKQEIVASRVDTTGELVAFCGRLDSPPAALVSASAVGYYGPRGDEKVTEEESAGSGFSAALCRDWEAAARQAESLGVRVCLARLGVVFDREGGAFEELARPFRLGVANWIGDGRQWLSWVHRSDVVAAIDFLLQHDGLSGPFNLTAPEPVTSRGLCAAMKKHLNTWLTLPMPASAMRLLVGEMADELLISGQRVLPARLTAAGFAFTYPDIAAALDAVLDKS
jgi:uncharacterized protein (TIGR01777 family)